MYGCINVSNKVYEKIAYKKTTTVHLVEANNTSTGRCRFWKEISFFSVQNLPGKVVPCCLFIIIKGNFSGVFSFFCPKKLKSANEMNEVWTKSLWHWINQSAEHNSWGISAAKMPQRLQEPEGQSDIQLHCRTTGGCHWRVTAKKSLQT